MADKDQTLTIPALERNFKIGQLYDYCRDSIEQDIPSISDEEIAKCVSETSLTDDVKINCSYAKACEVLGIDPNTRLNICLGFVKPGVRIKPLFEHAFVVDENDPQRDLFFVEKCFQKAVRVDLSRLPNDPSALFGKAEASTHIVTGIIYGREGVIQSADGSGKEGRFSIEAGTEDIQNDPQTMIQRIELCPINQFQKGKEFKEIDDSLVLKTLSMVETMRYLEETCEQILRGTAAKPKALLLAEISAFKALISKQNEKTMEYLKDLIPGIRDTDEEEDDLMTFITEMEASPLNLKVAVNWLHTKIEELNVIDEISNRLGPKAFAATSMGLVTKLKKLESVCNLHIKVPKKDRLLTEMEAYMDEGSNHTLDVTQLHQFQEDAHQMKQTWELLQGHLEKGEGKIEGLFSIEKSDVLLLESKLRFYVKGKLMNPDASSAEQSGVSPTKPQNGMTSPFYPPTGSRSAEEKTLASPGIPLGEISTYNTIQLDWTVPPVGEGGHSVCKYIIHDENGKHVKTVDGDTTYTEIKITGKQVPAFTVQADYGEHGVSPQSEPSEPFESTLWEDAIPDGLEPMQAFGQPFQVGQLYDRCCGMILDEKIQMKDLKGNIITNYFPTENAVSETFTFKETLDKMAINAETQLDVDIGFLKPGGAKSFLTDGRDHQNSMFRVQQFAVKTEHIHHRSLMVGAQRTNDDLATHIIAGITYGCEIVSYENAQDENVDIYHDLSKNSLNGCKMDMVEADVKKVLKESPSKAVPVKVHLYPIPNRDYRSVDPEHAKRAIAVLKHYQNRKFNCDRLNGDRMKTISAMTTKVEAFKSLFVTRKSQFLKALAKLIPKIRGVKEDSAKFGEQLEAEENSPFNENTAQRWFKLLDEDFDYVEEMKAKLSGVEMYQSYTELSSKIESFDGYMYCFAIAVSKEDRIMRDMHESIYQPEDLTRNATSGFNDRSTVDEKLKTFLQIKESQPSQDSNRFGFLICNKLQNNTNNGHLEASVHQYMNGQLIAVDVRYLSKPEDLHALYVKDSSILLKWTDSKNTAPVEYDVIVLSQDGSTNNCHSETCEILIDGLAEEHDYEITVCSVSGTMKSELSDKLQVRTPKADVTCPPGKPNCREIESQKLEIEWSPPARRSKKIENYLIHDEIKGQLAKVEGTIGKYILNPELNTEYKITVVADYGKYGTSTPSEPSDMIQVKKQKRNAGKDTITNNATLCTNTKGPPVYLLKSLEDNETKTTKNETQDTVNETKNKENETKAKKRHFWKPSKFKKEKTIMLLGATGSGKTTLINGMVNYILGVEWEDDFRVRLIREEKPADSQAQSKTSIITSYTLHHQPWFKVPYTVTIVDTPGFGDSEGIKRDREITQMIKQFFQAEGDEGLDQISAIGFVAQSSNARLTISQHYIFDSIMSLFSLNIEGNIIPLLTFGDGQRPPVLDALKAAGVPCDINFKFNNSALFVANSKEDASKIDFDFNQMFWNMGFESSQDFFRTVETIESKSLTLTKELLIERERLLVQIEGINIDIESAVTKLHSLDTEMELLKKHETTMDLNKDFEYTTTKEEQKLEKIPEGNYTTNCLNCKQTCHYPCAIKEDGAKKGCAAMSGGYCVRCPDKCIWSDHRNLPHKYIIEIKTITLTSEDLKERYQNAKGEKMTQQRVVDCLAKDVEAMHQEVISRSLEAKKCLARIGEIALKPNPLSTTEYIDLMIEAETNEKKYGYVKRLEQLHLVRKTAIILDQLTKDGFDPSRDQAATIKKVKEKYKSDEGQDQCSIM